MHPFLRCASLLAVCLLLGGCFPLTRGVHALGRSHEILDPVALFRDDAGRRYAVVLNADYIRQLPYGHQESCTKILFVADAAVQEGPLVVFDPVADAAPGLALEPADFGAGMDDGTRQRVLAAGWRELTLRRSEDGAFLDDRRAVAVRVRVASDEEHRREQNAWWAWTAVPLYVPAAVIDVVILPFQAVMAE
jgi:hypothetical protein